MRVLAEVIPPHGEYLNESVFCAVQGFRDRGYEVVRFKHGTDQVRNAKSLDWYVLDGLYPSDTVVVGSIAAVRHALRESAGVSPNLPTYPPCLKDDLGREIHETTSGEFLNTSQVETCLGKFVKPVEQKLFTGKVMETVRDLTTLGKLPESTPILVSNRLNLLLEARVFVLRGEILDIRPYRGDPGSLGRLNTLAVIPQCVKKMSDWEDCPVAYALDVGVTLDRELWHPTRVVEVNDAFALGHYGLARHHFTAMIEARWQELTSNQ